MISEIFFTRYAQPLLYGADGVPRELGVLLRQLTHIAMMDLPATGRMGEAFWQKAHDRLARELGIFQLAEGDSFEDRCGRYLADPFDLWNNSHRSPDYYYKTRLSLIELLFRTAEEYHTARVETDAAFGGILSWRQRGKRNLPAAQNLRAEFDKCVSELNVRLAGSIIRLHYHAGILQVADDNLTTSQIGEPFWEAIRDHQWQNVSVDMKEALDRRDSGGRDAALYAMKALESAVKIVSDKNGWTRGTERGAANYIDNLVSSANGRFVEPWEAEMLKALFSRVRNPHGHGPGSEAMPEFSPPQQTWVIENAMSWIKSLLHRLQ